MKLNIYKGKEIEKTYEADTYDVPFGVLDDLTGIVDIDRLLGADVDGQGTEAIRLVVKAMPQIKALTLEIFPGLTEEELRRASSRDLVQVFMELISHLFNSIMGLDDGDPKN